MSGEGSPTTRWFVAVAERVGFPYIPGVTFNGLMTTGDLFDYAPSFAEGTRRHREDPPAGHRRHSAAKSCRADPFLDR